ncbi:MAG: VCBS repeat-containing protein [Actinomycetia bacterium]|nr:VCBS repeat-containing protein [Actinomycetes bacterium]
MIVTDSLPGRRSKRALVLAGSCAILIAIPAAWTPRTAARAETGPTAWSATDVGGAIGLQISSGTDGQLCAVDVDPDGMTDLVLSMHGSDPWPLLRQSPDGSFARSYEFGPVSDYHGCTSSDFASVNEDGTFGPPDGRVDFYFTTGACQGKCTKPYPNRLYVQTPIGTYVDAAAALQVDNPHGRGRDAVAVDANADGISDIYVTNEPSSLFVEPNHLYINQAPGFVERAEPQATGQYSSKCAAKVTYFFANTPDGFVDVRASLGVPSSETYRDVALADVNGDGHLDLLAVRQTKFLVRLWRGPTSQYGAISYQIPLQQGRSLAVGDLLGSGRAQDVYVVDGWKSGSLRQATDQILQWTGSATTTSFAKYVAPQALDTGRTTAPLNGEGDQVTIVPNWAGTGRGLAVISNGLYVKGTYQAVTMEPVLSPTP